MACPINTDNVLVTANTLIPRTPLTELSHREPRFGGGNIYAGSSKRGARIIVLTALRNSNNTALTEHIVSILRVINRWTPAEWFLNGQAAKNTQQLWFGEQEVIFDKQAA
jgi:hypothetical protein